MCDSGGEKINRSWSNNFVSRRIVIKILLCNSALDLIIQVMVLPALPFTAAQQHYTDTYLQWCLYIMRKKQRPDVLLFDELNDLFSLTLLSVCRQSSFSVRVRVQFI